MDDRFLNRGKSKDNGEWVIGYYYPTAFTRFPCKPSIYPADTINHHWHAVEIIPETLGSCTGLTDKKGKMMFDGDVIRYKANECCDIYIVKWDITAGRFAVYGLGLGDNFPLGDFVFYDLQKCEIIGNIYDNPELLESEAE